MGNKVPIICDICGKIIDSDIRKINISNESATFYEYHLHKKCIVENSLLKTVAFLVAKEVR